MQPVVAKCSQIVVNIEGKPCIRGNPGTPRPEGSHSSGVGPDRATADGRLAGDQVARDRSGPPAGQDSVPLSAEERSYANRDGTGSPRDGRRSPPAIRPALPQRPAG